jgi:hypothetical protein
VAFVASMQVRRKWSTATNPNRNLPSAIKTKDKKYCSTVVRSNIYAPARVRKSPCLERKVHGLKSLAPIYLLY